MTRYEQFCAALHVADGDADKERTYDVLMDAASAIEAKLRLAAYVVKATDGAYVLRVAGSTGYMYDVCHIRAVPGEKVHVKRFGKATYDTDVGDTYEQNAALAVAGVRASIAALAGPLAAMDADARGRLGLSRCNTDRMPY